jgi:hypothetical protein
LVVEGTAVDSNGAISTSFEVPESATVREYTVLARCVENREVQKSAPFKVTEPEPAIVPDLVGMDATEAGRALSRAELVLGQSTGDGDTVQSQKPAAGTEVEPHSPVDIDFGTAPPKPHAVVPRIVDLLVGPLGFGSGGSPGAETSYAARTLWPARQWIPAVLSASRSVRCRCWSPSRG